MFIESEYIYLFVQLINYKGKLCGTKVSVDDDDDIIKLNMWVLEDVEKQNVYTLPENEVIDSYNLSIVSVTATGEIVLSKEYIDKPFTIFYFNPERNTLQHIEIQGFEALKYGAKVKTFVDYVEDLSLNDAKQLKSSIYAPSLKKKKKKKKKRSKRPKPQHL